MNVGTALKYLRNKKNLTLDEVAEALNKSIHDDVVTFNKGKLSKWENGKEEPKLSALKYVADFYGVSIDEMIAFSMEQVEKQELEVFNSLVDALRDLALDVKTTFVDNSILKVNVSNSFKNLDIPYGDFVRDPITTYKSITKELISGKRNKLPLLGQIACGTPIMAEENIEDYFEIDEKINADFVLRCKGDSMVDEGILPGDYVFIRKQQTLENGEIGAILIDGEATLKRFYKTEKQIILQPANSEYQPIILEQGNVNILGKLVAVLNIK